ncbi:MAG: hypothetical protein ABUK20_05850 [Anaerolineales bacterium]
MSERIDLKEADRRVFTTSFDDGLVDIFISGVVLMLVIAPLLSVYLGDFWSSAIFLPFYGVIYMVIRWVRKNVIKPRGGVVKYGPMRRKKMTLFTGIMLALNVIFMILALFAFFSFIPGRSGWIVTIPFSLMLLVSFSLAGYFLSVTRFYVYGLMLAGGFFLGEWLYQTYGVAHHGIPLVFGISAAIIFVTGLIKFFKFLQDNPLPTDESLQWEGENG